MKKTIAIIMLVLLIIVNSVSVYAVEPAPKAELVIKANTDVIKDEKTVEITLSLGELKNLEENENGITLGYEATLSYEKEMFEKVEVEGLNGWTVNYEETTNKIVGEMDTAEPNKDIAKITLTLKDKLESGKESKIALNDILLTDGVNDFEFNLSSTVTVEKGESPELPDEEEPDTNTNTNTPEEPNTNKVTDNTISNAGKLPAAGLETLIIVAIIITAIALVIFKIKSKDIKY